MGKLFYMRKAPHATHHCIDSMFWIQRRRLRVRVQRIGARMLRRRIEIHFRYFVRFSGLLMLRQWELIERWTIRVTEQIMFLCWRRTQIRFDDSVWHFVECHTIGECVCAYVLSARSAWNSAVDGRIATSVFSWRSYRTVFHFEWNWENHFICQMESLH